MRRAAYIDGDRYIYTRIVVFVVAFDVVPWILETERGRTRETILQAKELPTPPWLFEIYFTSLTAGVEFALE